MKISDIYRKFFSNEIKVNYDYPKELNNVMSIISDLDLVEKVNKKSTHELKAIALELLFLGSSNIRIIARSTNSFTESIHNISEGMLDLFTESIHNISEGMQDLPHLIAYVENDEVEQSPFYTKTMLESEIIKCIRTLIMNLRIKIENEIFPCNYSLGGFFSKYFNLNDDYVHKILFRKGEFE